MSETLLLGMVIKNRYRIERELGRGGFGAVFLAFDQKLMDRPVVVKILLEQGKADGWFKRKFSEEIEALSRINHPGIVSVIDTGVLEAGQPYMVQQFVEGSTLRESIRPGGMDLVRVARVIRKVGQALTAAHQKGVVHRDLKPDNIMLHSVADGDEHATIIDFGIASVSDMPDGIPEKTKVTGTFTYMAPEQFDGHPSAASDIYALGIIAFEMLAGAPPSAGKPLFELMLMQKEGHWPRISELRPSVPREAQELILRALSRHPEQRFESAAAFGEELARALVSSIPTTTQIPDLAELALPRKRPRRWIWAVTGIAAAAALIAVAATVTPTTKIPITEKRVEEARQPTASLPLPEVVYSYKIAGSQSIANGQPAGKSYRPGDKVSFEVEFAQDGYFYAVDQSAKYTPNVSVYSNLFPTPGRSQKVRKGDRVKLPSGGRYTISQGEGIPYLWLIFSPISLPAFEGIPAGHIDNPAVSRRIREFIQPLRDREPALEMARDENKISVRSSDNVVVQRIELSLPN